MVLLLLVVVVHDLVVGIDHVVLLLRASRLAAGRLFGAPAPAPPPPPPRAPPPPARPLNRSAPGRFPPAALHPSLWSSVGGPFPQRPLLASPALAGAF